MKKTERATNESLREIFSVSKRSASIISRLINKTIKEGLIKVFDSSSKSNKYKSYIPYWAYSYLTL